LTSLLSFLEKPEGENQCVCLWFFITGFVLDLLLSGFFLSKLLSVGLDEKSSFEESDEANLQSKGAR